MPLFCKTYLSSNSMVMAFEDGFHLPPGGGELLGICIGVKQNLDILLIEGGTVCGISVGM